MSRNPREAMLVETLSLMDQVNANLDRLAELGVDCLDVRSRDRSFDDVGMFVDNVRVSLLLKFRTAV